MNENLITSIAAAVLLVLALVTLFLMGIYDLRKAILIKEKEKEFSKTLTTEQKALIHDYEQCKKVNVFKKEK